jgi:hypothetical protein
MIRGRTTADRVVSRASPEVSTVCRCRSPVLRFNIAEQFSLMIPLAIVLAYHRRGWCQEFAVQKK